jgi:hypothetical protein
MVGRVRRSAAIVVMDPNARTKPLGVLVRICDIVSVRKENVDDATGGVEPIHQLRGKARRVDEQVATWMRDEI